MNPARPLLSACLILSFAIPATATHSIESTVATDGITIDGNTNDWDDWPVVYLQDSLRVVSVSHDDENLYIMYRFGDSRVAEQLLHRGVVLWINGDGKKKNKNDAFGVRYAGSEEIAIALEASREGCNAGATPDRSGGRGYPDLPEEDRPRSVPVGVLTVIRDGIRETAENGASGFQSASTAIEGVYAYELGIPMDEIGGKLADTPSTKARKLAVGIQVGGLTKAESELMEENLSQMQGQGGGAGGRGGGMGGGGMGGGDMGGPGGGGMGGRGGGMGGRPGGPGGGRPNLNPEIDWLVVELPPMTG